MSSATPAHPDLRAALQRVEATLASDPAAAATEAEAILRAHPGYPVAVLLLGIARRLNGELEASLEILSGLAASQANSAIAQFEYGVGLAAAGRRAEAIARLERAVGINRDLTAGWRALAETLTAEGRLDKARAAYSAYLAAASKDPQLAWPAGEPDAARMARLQALRERVAARPNDLAACRLLGETELAAGHLLEARELFARCTELAPAMLQGWRGLAVACYRRGDLVDALRAVEELLRALPEEPDHLSLLGAIQTGMGEVEAALSTFARLTALRPDSVRYRVSEAMALRSAGRVEESIAAYRECIRQQPGFGHAWWGLSDLKRYRFSEQDEQEMARLLADPALKGEDRWHIGFALGKALEDRGDYGSAFAHYAEANHLRRSTLNYDRAELDDWVARSRRLFTPEFVSAHAASGCTRADPIFVVGLPRSGSTLIEQVLASHSEVEGTMELADMITLARELGRLGAVSGGGYHDALATLEPARLAELGEHYLQRTAVHRKSGVPRFIDKQSSNFLHAGLILLMLPQARIIDARRHPMACGFSNYKQMFHEGQRFAFDLGELAHYYRGYVELMAHFDAVFPGRILRVHYEDMVSDTEAQVRRMLDYCELPFEEACLRFYENDRSVRTASSEQVRQPIYRQGVEQWKHFEPWLGPLKEGLGEVLERYPAVPEFPPA